MFVFLLLFLFSSHLDSFLGKAAKALVADEVGGVIEVDDEEEDGAEVTDEVNKIVLSKLSDSGLFFSHETAQDFVLYFSVPLQSVLRVS